MVPILIPTSRCSVGFFPVKSGRVLFKETYHCRPVFPFSVVSILKWHKTIGKDHLWLLLFFLIKVEICFINFAHFNPSVSSLFNANKLFIHIAFDYCLTSSDAFIDTNPFSSFRCWYSSALLLTEFKRPINSWCFLELAVLILLLHKDSKDIGPKIACKNRWNL